MSVDAKAEIVIARPREEVASTMFDPKCDKLWIGGLKNVFRGCAGIHPLFEEAQEVVTAGK